MNPISVQPSSVDALITELEGQIARSEAATGDSFSILEEWKSRAQKGSEKRELESQELNRMLREALESSRDALERAMKLIVSISDKRKQLHQRNPSELRDAQDSVEKLEILPRTLDVNSIRDEVRSSNKEMQGLVDRSRAIKEILVSLDRATNELRQQWGQKISAVQMDVDRKRETFHETAVAFSMRSKELKSKMKSARNLCLDA